MLLLSNAFTAFLKNEWLGLIASVFVLVSFITSNQIKTRLINLVGCVAFIIYGLVLPAYSTAIMNLGILIVHIVFLTKFFIGRRKEKQTNEKKDEERSE